MAHIIVNYIAPVILLVITVFMFLNDTAFFKSKSFEKSPSQSLGWQLVRLGKYIAVISVIYGIYSLDPRFMQDKESVAALIADPAQKEALASYSTQWCIIIFLSAVFAILFLADIWCRIKTIHSYHDHKLNLFIQDEIKAAARSAADSALSTADSAFRAAEKADSIINDKQEP